MHIPKLEKSVEHLYESRKFFLLNNSTSTFLTYNVEKKVFEGRKKINNKNYIQEWIISVQKGNDIYPIACLDEKYFEIFSIRPHIRDLNKQTAFLSNKLVALFEDYEKVNVKRVDLTMKDYNGLLRSNQKWLIRKKRFKNDPRVFYSFAAEYEEHVLHYIDVENGDKKDGAKVNTWAAKKNIRPSKSQLWHFIDVDESPLKKKHVFRHGVKSLKTSCKNEAKLWIPSELVMKILEYVTSPKTFLLLRQCCQQLYIETKRNVFWLFFIKHSCNATEEQFKKVQKNFEKLIRSKAKTLEEANDLNLMNLYWKNYFPKSRRKDLVSNSEIIKSYNSFSPHLFPFRAEEIPWKFDPSISANNAPNSKMKCICCEKEFKIIKNRPLEIFSWSYDYSNWGGSPNHWGYCTKSCFNKHLVKVPKFGCKSFDKSEIFKRSVKRVMGYYPVKWAKKAFKGYDEYNFFEDIVVGGDLFVDISFGGPYFRAFYEFKGEMKKKARSFLDDKYKKYNLGMFYITCDARMGDVHEEEVIYFLFR